MTSQMPETLARMREVSEKLANPDIPADELEQHYAELRQINTQLRQEDARRRSTPIRFSNGLEMMPAKIAWHIRKSSIADFCIQHGLSRAEVLERTGLSQAGVS